ncbi:MAG TPA: hypothetical protein VGK77_13135 [Candidatus Binatia bacterium]|jgi:uncharacterized protein HemX
MSLESLQTFSNVTALIGAILVALGGFGHFYFGKQIDAEKQRAEKQTQEQQAIISVTQAEQLRRRQILSQLRQLYILSHDGVSAEMMSGVAPLPKDWVEQKLKERGETWRQEQYY